MWFTVVEEKPDIGTVIFKADDYYERLQKITGMWNDNKFLYYDMLELFASPEVSEDEEETKSTTLFSLNDVTNVPLLMAYLEKANLKGHVPGVMLDFMWDLHRLYLNKMKEFGHASRWMSKKDYTVRNNREKWTRFITAMQELQLTNLKEETEARHRKRRLRPVNMKIYTRVETLPTRIRTARSKSDLRKRKKGRKSKKSSRAESVKSDAILDENNEEDPKRKDRFRLKTEADNPFSWDFGGTRLFDRIDARQVGKHPEFSKIVQKIFKSMRFSKCEPVDWRTITLAEVDTHRYYTDCWMAIKGRVYDVTDFIEKHPGGRPLIMQGAGTDITDIFVTVHPYVVFYKHLVQKQIGTLPNYREHERTQWESPVYFDIFRTLKEWYTRPRNRYKHWSPTASFKQSDVEFTYTVTFPSSLVSREDDWTVSIIDGFTVTIIKFVDPPYVWYGGFDLRDKVLDDTVYRCFSGDFNTLELKIAKTYKEVISKPIKDRRQDDGFFLSSYSLKDMYRASIVERMPIADGVKLYGITLGMNKYIGCPVGCYVNLRILDETRPYTPICLPDEYDETFQENREGGFQTLYFIVKEYKDGDFTSMLHYFPMKKMIKDVELYVSPAMGNFHTPFLFTNMSFMLLLAGGTGISVMTRIIQEYIVKNKEMGGKEVFLLFFVQLRDDLIWRRVWLDIEKRYKWFHFFYSFTRVIRYTLPDVSAVESEAEAPDALQNEEKKKTKSVSQSVKEEEKEAKKPEDEFEESTLVEFDEINPHEMYGPPTLSKLARAFSHVTGAMELGRHKALVCGPSGFNHHCEKLLQEFGKHEDENVYYFAA